jgi:asparagine synthase (glutamine-hydrolysing)
VDVGFSVLVRGPSVECRLYGPRAGALPLVSCHQTADHAAVLLGRLYYRDELRAELGPAGMGAAVASTDAALALEAYRRFGAETLRRLEGDFALVVWSARQGRVVGMRDPLGGFPLFWACHDGVFVFSTTLRPLLRVLPGRALDGDYLADYLALPRCSEAEVGNERCAYRGVRRVLPGSVVGLDTATGGVRQQASWDWLEHAEDPGSDRLEEVAAGVAQRLRCAVRERMQGLTASHLSGGMDSTGVCLIARDLALGGAAPAPVHGLTLVYDKLTELARETAYVDIALRDQPGIVSHRLAGDEALRYDAFASPPPSDEPCPVLESLGQHQVMVEEAARAGATTLLTGIGSDEMLEVPPYHLTDLLRRGRLLGAWAEAGRWARAYNLGLWQVLWPYGLANLLPTCLRGGLGALLRGGYAGWRQQNNTTIPPWVRPDFARRHGLHGRILAHVHRYGNTCRPAGLSVALDAIASKIGDSTRWLLAAPRGLSTAHPFLDTRLLRFGLGVRARLQPAPGRQKPILAEALRGTLPEEIRNRRGKGHFNETYFLGLRRNLPHLEALVLRAPGECLEWLDRDALLRHLHQAGLGVAPDAVGTDRMGLALSLLQWLSRQDEWQRRPIQATRVVCWRGPDVPAAGTPRARASLALH